MTDEIRVHVAQIAVIATALVMGAIRPFLAPHPVSSQGSYEAFAHLFVGGVIGAWIVTKSRWLLIVAIGLTVVEVVSAVAGSVLH